MRLDRKIEMQTLTEVSSDTSINYTTSWATLFPARAKVEFKRGFENIAGEQVTAIQEVVFTIRNRSGFDESSRIRYNSKSYQIKAIEEVERNRYLRISTKLVSN